MKKAFIVLAIMSLAFTAISQGQEVAIVYKNDGMILTVDGEPFMVNGMNWDYFPIGTNYSYNFWAQPDEFIKAALEDEMSLLQDMGVNAIRVYTGIQPKWITYIYDNYGIYTMLNHSFGRYGLSLDGEWVAKTDYADPGVKEVLISEATAMVKEMKDIPGLLLYLLGNENNYGLFWEGAETEDIPDEVETPEAAVALYKLFNEAAIAMKEIDKTHPVALCNGDLQYLDIIKKECKDIDVFGTNIYRGLSFGDAFERVNDELNKPILFTEFGADAYNAINGEEDQESQAVYNLANWKEVYQNAAGMGLTGNSIGGFTFQFSDGWWKFGQTVNLDVHDNNASWANGGYASDYQKGRNNMNEEWFGICAKGPTDEKGFYTLTPRKAFYVLKEAHRFNPYIKGVTLNDIDKHFSGIEAK